MPLDDLDKKILQYLSSGTCSYEELARACNVTRNTIYRRIASLENRGIIKNTISCIINLDQLDITPVCISVKMPQADQEKACHILSAHKNVRLLLRTYGDYDLVIFAFSPKGDEGKIIQSITATLEDLKATKLSIAVGFVWEKTDLNTVEGRTDFVEMGTMIEPSNFNTPHS